MENITEHALQEFRKEVQILTYVRGGGVRWERERIEREGGRGKGRGTPNVISGGHVTLI